MKTSLPDMITYSRFFFAILLIPLSLYRLEYPFIALYLLAVTTDILDGFIARRTKTASEKGKRLDILADNFLLVCLAVSFYIQRKGLLMLYRWQILSVFVLYLAVQAISLARRREPVFMRTYAANSAAALFPLAAITLFYSVTDIFAYIYLFLMYYSLLEKLLITLTSKRQIAGKALFAVFFLGMIFASIIISQMARPMACFDDGYCIMLEIRDTDQGREIGLMGRADLPESQGMLFIFDQPARYSFWMKGMLIPIDMAFLDKDKRIILLVKDAKPCREEPCEINTPDSEALYVIETQANFSIKHGLGEGQAVYLTRM